MIDQFTIGIDCTFTMHLLIQWMDIFGVINVGKKSKEYTSSTMATSTDLSELIHLAELTH
jgi:hypothetical protein